eukprot:1377033-Amorphochlora_amoeboformis.AAC.2
MHVFIHIYVYLSAMFSLRASSLLSLANLILALSKANLFHIHENLYMTMIGRVHVLWQGKRGGRGIGLREYVHGV